MVALVYVPYKIITAIVKVEGKNGNDPPLIEHKLPTMTIMSGTEYTGGYKYIQKVQVNYYDQLMHGSRRGGYQGRNY